MIDTVATELFATEIIDIGFLNGRSAQLLPLSSQHTVSQALEIMGLTAPQPALVIIGGATLISPDVLAQLQSIFDQVFAPLAQELGLTVLDGGTDAGVIHMIGQARHHIGGHFRLIGVVPQGKAKLAQDSITEPETSRYALEPNHTHFFLIPGQEWGSESPWLANFASQIATHQPALTILINGGTVALTDLQVNLATGRPALVLAGSGRLADQIAAAMTGAEVEVSEVITELVQTYQPSGKLGLIHVSTPHSEMRDRIRQYFVSAS